MGQKNTQKCRSLRLCKFVKIFLGFFFCTSNTNLLNTFTSTIRCKFLKFFQKTEKMVLGHSYSVLVDFSFFERLVQFKLCLRLSYFEINLFFLFFCHQSSLNNYLMLKKMSKNWKKEKILLMFKIQPVCYF